MPDQDAPYRLWLNHAKTVLVRIWVSGLVEVSSREHPDQIWGPPMRMTEEKVTAND